MRFVVFFLFCMPYVLPAQLPVARDTISVIENGYVLKMPWGNAFNYVNVSSVDLNLDQKKDIVLFDRYNQYNEGRFRCFINTGKAGASMFKADPDMSYWFPRAFNWAILMDYDNDGREDIFCSGNSNVMVYRNVGAAGTPSFTLVKSVLKTDISTTSVPFYAPLFVSVIGLPGISDVDNDGDLDILSFSSQGTFVEFHKNMSMELYSTDDSLIFKYASDCWGDVAESSCTVDFNLCNNSKAAGQMPRYGQRGPLHAGSCLSCIDSDGDGDKDLVMGDVACTRVQYVHNNGTPANPSFNDTTKIYPNYKNNNTLPVKMNSFPCGYFLDVNGDNKRDFLVSPNSYGSENYKSLWYYNNASSSNTVNFVFVKNNFLQDEMIEVGQNSFPVLFDYDGDNRKDLLIGTYGYYLNNSLSPGLTLYKNIGTAAVPQFSLVSRDYAGLTSVSNIYYTIPTIGDIDGDGDVDICIGTLSGQVHWLENTAGAGNACNFSVFHNNPFQFTTFSAVAAPQLFDLDGDNLLDLLIGTKNGRIAYYKNTGTVTTPSFALVTNTLGNVLTTDDPNLFGYDGYASPFFYKENNTIHLLVGSISGKLMHYTVGSNVLAPFTLVNTQANNYNEGGQSAPCYEDVNNDGKRDLFIGNASGGLSFFSSRSPYVGIREANKTEPLTIYPNPTGNELYVSVTKGYTLGATELYDFTGRLLLHCVLNTDGGSINLSGLGKGVYFIRIPLLINGEHGFFTKKIIKE